MWGGSLNYRKSEKKRCVLPIGKPVGLITDLLMGDVLGDSLGRDRVWVLDATDRELFRVDCGSLYEFHSLMVCHPTTDRSHT